MLPNAWYILMYIYIFICVFSNICIYSLNETVPKYFKYYAIMRFDIPKDGAVRYKCDESTKGGIIRSNILKFIRVDMLILNACISFQLSAIVQVWSVV